MIDDKNFLDAFETLLKFEGGYVNDPTDPGGETKYGVSKRAFPHLDIKNLTQEDAKEIFYNSYWVKNRCGEIAEESKEVGAKLFDMSVNMGPNTAAKLLQRAVRAIDARYKLAEDGIIGPLTITALEDAISTDGNAILAVMKSEAANYYRNLPTQLKDRFLDGWLKRAYA
ncbi:MAG: N-acetylmuramidase [Holosporaceae bacterium]|nr:N-acetylmuramidase [Holosporaceae bacterium]